MLGPKAIMGTSSAWASVFTGLLGPFGVTLRQAVGDLIWAVGNNRIEITALGARV